MTVGRWLTLAVGNFNIAGRVDLDAFLLAKVCRRDRSRTHGLLAIAGVCIWYASRSPYTVATEGIVESTITQESAGATGWHRTAADACVRTRCRVLFQMADIGILTFARKDAAATRFIRVATGSLRQTLITGTHWRRARR